MSRRGQTAQKQPRNLGNNILRKIDYFESLRSSTPHTMNTTPITISIWLPVLQPAQLGYSVAGIPGRTLCTELLPTECQPTSPIAANALPNTMRIFAVFFKSLSVRGPLGVSSLPLSFSALHLLFRDGKHLANGIVEAFGFGLTGDRRGGSHIHASRIHPHGHLTIPPKRANIKRNRYFLEERASSQMGEIFLASRRSHSA